MVDDFNRMFYGPQGLGQMTQVGLRLAQAQGNGIHLASDADDQYAPPALNAELCANALAPVPTKIRMLDSGSPDTETKRLRSEIDQLPKPVDSQSGEIAKALKAAEDAATAASSCQPCRAQN